MKISFSSSVRWCLHHLSSQTKWVSLAEETLAQGSAGWCDVFGKRGGFSQGTFAFRVGLHRTYMGDIERGAKNVTLVTADKLANGLDLTLAGLFSELKRPASDPDEG